MNCRHYAEFEGVCVNAASPYCADVCPVMDHQEICTHSTSREEKTNLDGKCGSCKHGTPCSFHATGNLTYVRCGHPEKVFKREYQAVKQRTTKACKKYERVER